LGTADTFYTRVGDWVGWVCLAGFVFFIVFQEVTSRRERAKAQTAELREA